MPTCRTLSAASLIATLLVSPAAADEKAGHEFFEAKIRPVLVRHCYECHSAESKPVQGGLRLDTRDAMRTGGDSGPGIAPGSPAESLVLAALKYDSYEMPPKGKLADAVIADFSKWIEMGAPDPRQGGETAAPTKIDFAKAANYWAFQPPTKKALPRVSNPHWTRNEIDHFVLSALDAAGLQPVGEASKRALLRRATFDLLGLPPTPEEQAAFLADESPDAYVRLIDRLLDSPHYGERWGRYWLDVARFADDQAHTFAVKPNTEAWRYREWVIDAFNRDLPYDQFVRMQIAGDQLDESLGQERFVALGYFGLGAVYYKNSDKAKAEADELDDRIDTLTRGFLGLTVSCARCHDHKFDPIPTNDYYSLAGIFSSSALANVPLAEKEVVDAYNAGQQTVKNAEKAFTDRMRELRESAAENAAPQIEQYVLAVWKQRVAAAQGKPLSDKQLATTNGLAEPAIKLWREFLDAKNRGKYPAIEGWYALPAAHAQASLDSPPANVKAWAASFQQQVQNLLLARDGKLAPQKEAVVNTKVEPANSSLPLFASKQLNHERPAAEVDVDLKGARELYLLITDAGDGKSCDHADWAEPRLVTSQGEVKLTDLKWRTATTGFGSINLHRSVGGGKLRIGERAFEYGLGSHAPSLIVYDLPPGAERFKATVGLDVSGTRQGNGATVEFLVYTTAPPTQTALAADRAAATKANDSQLTKADAELLKAVFFDGGLFKLADKPLKESLSAADLAQVDSLQASWDQAQRDAPAMYPVAHAIRDTSPKDMHVFIRGNPARQGEVAPRQFLQVLSEGERKPYAHGSGRLELAEDLARADNPLTARVMANRVWQQHFGRGIVGTPSNFGELGERPSHPELLDWLAVDFVESGWSVKHLHRQIMLSATYRLSSEANARNSELDGDNRLLWRMNRRRLDVEAWRDSLLAVSGNLDRTVGGPNAPLTGSRRTVYAKISRHELDELLRLFDFPDANVTSEKRTVTTAPQQQLFVLNSNFVVQQAQSLAKRVQAGAATGDARVRLAFELLYARAPHEHELRLGLDFLAAAASDASEQKIDPWQQYAQALLSLNEFMYID